MARNLLFLVAGEVSGRFLTFVGTVYLARTLGAEGFGALSLAVVLVTYLSFGVHFGLDQVGGREVARNPRARTAYAAGIVTLRGLLAVVVYAMLTLVVFAVPRTWFAARVVLTQGLVLFALAANLSWAFQGLEWMGGYALAASLGQVVFVAAALEFVKGPKDVGRAPLCYLAGEAMATILLLIQFVRRFGLSFPLRDRAWLVSLGEGLPFLMSRLVRTIGVTFDVFALKLYLGDTAVGLYGAASRIALSVLGVAVLYFVNVTPALARVALTEPAWLQSLFTKSLRLSAIAAVPIGIGGAIVGPAIVTMLFGPAYAGAGTALRLLLVGVSVTLVSQNYRILLVASSHQRAEMAIVSASAVLTIILNVLLVPQLGLAGAGIAFLASEMLLLALGLGAVRFLVGMEDGLRHLVRPLAASIIMAVVLLATTSVPLVARLSAAALAYGAAVLALRGTTLAELRDLFVVRRHLPPAPGGE